MLESVFIPLRCSRGHSPVHPASAVRHRRRLARVSAPRSGSAAQAEVRGRAVLHRACSLIPVNCPDPCSLSSTGYVRPVNVDVRIFQMPLAELKEFEAGKSSGSTGRTASRASSSVCGLTDAISAIAALRVAASCVSHGPGAKAVTSTSASREKLVGKGLPKDLPECGFVRLQLCFRRR